MRQPRIAALIVTIVALAGIGIAVAQPPVMLPLVSTTRAPDVTCEGSKPASYNNGSGPLVIWLSQYSIIPGQPLVACAHSSMTGPTVSVYMRVYQQDATLQLAPVPIPTSGIVTIPFLTSGLPSNDLLAIEMVLQNDKTPEAQAGPLFLFVRGPTP